MKATPDHEKMMLWGERKAHRDRIVMLNRQLEDSKKEIQEMNRKRRKDRQEERSVSQSRGRNKIPGTHPKYKSYISRARGKGLPFELTEDQFISIINQPCTYCGGLSGTIDRIDSSIGYTESNVCPACWPCNRIKYTDSVQQMLDHVLRICQHNNLCLSPSVKPHVPVNAPF